MSQLLEIKGLIFANLVIYNSEGQEDKELKAAIFDVFDSINGDLDEQLYDPSGETEGFIEILNNILSSREDEDAVDIDNDENDNTITEEDKPIAEDVEDEVDNSIYKKTSTEENGSDF